MHEDVRRLEEKIAYLEHHVTEQDKVMLQMADDLARLRRELQLVTSRLGGASGGGGPAESAEDERPPHY